MTSAPVVQLQRGNDEPPRWLLDLEDVPETFLHDVIIELLKLVFKHRYSEQDVMIASNLACRWNPDNERSGIAPDVIMVTPAPPEGQALKALHLWRPEHAAPRLAVEIVSKSNAAKDYFEGPVRTADLGSEELWIFDPELHGPSKNGGPFVLQIFKRVEAQDGVRMEPLHQGPSPAYSPMLDAWLIATPDMRLRIADDADGKSLWPTKAEAAEEKANAAEEKANAAEEKANAAEMEIQRLRALLKTKK